MKPTEIVLASHKFFLSQTPIRKTNYRCRFTRYDTIPIFEDHKFRLFLPSDIQSEEKSNTIFSEAMQNNFILNIQQV